MCLKLYFQTLFLLSRQPRITHSTIDSHAYLKRSAEAILFADVRSVTICYGYTCHHDICYNGVRAVLTPFLDFHIFWTFLPETLFSGRKITKFSQKSHQSRVNLTKNEKNLPSVYCEYDFVSIKHWIVGV